MCRYGEPLSCWSLPGGAAGGGTHAQSCEGCSRYASPGGPAGADTAGSVGPAGSRKSAAHKVRLFFLSASDKRLARRHPIRPLAKLHDPCGGEETSTRVAKADKNTVRWY